MHCSLFDCFRDPSKAIFSAETVEDAFATVLCTSEFLTSTKNVAIPAEFFFTKKNQYICRIVGTFSRKSMHRDLEHVNADHFVGTRG